MRRIAHGPAARRLALSGAALALGCLAGSAGVLAADYRARAETPIAAPSCSDEGVLASIRDRFAYGAAHVEHRDLDLVTIEQIHETWASVDRPSPIPRRWCAAAVTLSDGTRSKLSYIIAGGVGFASPGLFRLTDAVEFCVAGHDPWRVHDGTCRTTRKFW